MITLYTWGTPNGHKISIMLEELGLAYKTIPIDISSNQQFSPSFLAINPNHKIPVLIDDQGPDGLPITLSESGAILIYLAEKTGKLLPDNARGRALTLQWLMFQMSSVGPMLGQAHHFLRFAPSPVPYAIGRYTTEAHRIYNVLNTQLAASLYLAGDMYSIADIAVWPWIARHDFHMIKLTDFPHIERWYQIIAQREAVIRAVRPLK